MVSKIRYAIDAQSGLLTDRNGHALGRVVGLTIETLEDGGHGGSSSSLVSTTKQETNVSKRGVGGTDSPQMAAQLLRETVFDVWTYYLEAIPSRRQLGEKQKRQIRNALKVRSLDEIKRAIDGLSVSPWHNGRNDNRKKYLELHHAIVARNAESTEERIDKAIGWGKTHGLPSMQPATVKRLFDEISFTYSLEHRPLQDRADKARAELQAAGYTVTLVPRAPFVVIER